MSNPLVKAVFFCSDEEESLDVFVDELLHICNNHDLTFNQIISIIQRLAVFNNPPEIFPY